MCKWRQRSIYQKGNLTNSLRNQLLDTLEENGAEPNVELRERFYSEAKRGMEAEEGHVSLAYVSTLGVEWT